MATGRWSIKRESVSYGGLITPAESVHSTRTVSPKVEIDLTDDGLEGISPVSSVDRSDVPAEESFQGRGESEQQTHTPSRKLNVSPVVLH